MFTIIIQEKGGEQRRMVFNKAEVTIGRVQGNDIVLPKGNVSKRHARIVLKDSKFIIVDLKSTNGTYVNGRKITSPLVVKDSDKIYVGDFIIGVDEAAGDGDQQENTTSPPGGNERLAPPPADNRPPRPTEAQPMLPPNVPMGGGMNGGRAPMGEGMGAGPMGGGMDRPPPMNGPGGMSRPGMGNPMGGGMDAPPPMGPGPMGGGMNGPSPGMGMRGNAPGPGPMGGMGGGGMGGGGMDDAPPPVAPPQNNMRPGPPRQPPGARPEGGLPPPGPRAGIDGNMPPIAPPQPRPMGGRPGGTMPPPIAPLPPMAPQPAPTSLEPPAMNMGMGNPPPMGIQQPMQQPPPVAAPVALPAPAPVMVAPIAPAPVYPVGGAAGAGAVVPIQQQQDKGAARPQRNLVGVAAKRSARSVAMPSRRGVHLDPLDPKLVKMLDLQSNILERLRAKLDLDKIPMDRLHEEELWQKAERATIDLVETLETSGELPKYIDQDTLIKETLNEALALGPLEDLLADEKIDEILIDRRDRVVVGKEGQLRGSGKAFSSDDVFERVVKRLVAEAGARIDEANPLVDLRMRDGTRLTAAVSPVAARGACLVLKKPHSHMPQLTELVTQNAMTAGMCDFLTTCVAARRNVLVTGAASSGKTTLVGALALASPAGERVVSIEEVAELSLGRDEWIQLETRAGNGKSVPVDLSHLLETALRLSPDRLVVGEVRGRESLSLVHALCAAVDGATVAMTGEGASGTLNRLALLARSANQGGYGSDLAIRELVAQAFEIVVNVVRWSDGTVRIASIEEVTGCTETGFDTQVLFQWRDNAYHATGAVPRFYAELESRGITADQAVFR